jgi:hypothetical protein
MVQLLGLRPPYNRFEPQNGLLSAEGLGCAFITLGFFAVIGVYGGLFFFEEDFVAPGISIVSIGLDTWTGIHPGGFFDSILYYTEDIQLITDYPEPSLINSLIVTAARVYASADTSKALALKENPKENLLYIVELIILQVNHMWEVQWI